MFSSSSFRMMLEVDFFGESCSILDASWLEVSVTRPGVRLGGWLEWLLFRGFPLLWPDKQRKYDLIKNAI
jgi:hypothetical protein